MYPLTAKYEVTLPDTCLGSWGKGSITIKCTIGDADVEVELIQHDFGPKSKKEDENLWTFPIQKANILVTLQEEESIPPVRVEEGTRNYKDQSEFFKERLHNYNEIAEEVYQRLLKYFKYKLGSPNIDITNVPSNDLRNPEFLYADGSEAGNSGIIHLVSPIVGYGDEILGIKALQKSDLKTMQNIIEQNIKHSLYQEIMSDARSAIINENLRRAVLELAIGCEILVKESFFSPDSTAGAAFEYLERKQQVNVSVPELINNIAKAAFGESYKDEHKEDYLSVDHLFRCRNKVAHRGQLYYHDDSSEKKIPDKDTLKDWFSSILKLEEWLNNNTEVT